MTSRNLTVSQITTNSLSTNTTNTSTLNVGNSASYFYIIQPTGRLSLTSGVPVTTADVTAATTLYYVPYKGNAIQIYNTVSNTWITYGFTQLSLSLSSFAGNNCYYIFIYNNSGSLALIQIAWTNNTTRATSLSQLNGQYVSSSNSGYLYLGTIYCSNAGQTQDAVSGRYVWNYYNRIIRQLYFFPPNGAAWNYTSTTIRQANGNSSYQLNCVVGLVEDNFDAKLGVYISSNGTAGDVSAGFGLNSTTAYASNSIVGDFNPQNTTALIQVTSFFNGYLSLGYNYIAWLENSNNSTITMYCSNSSHTYNAGIVANFLM